MTGWRSVAAPPPLVGREVEADGGVGQLGEDRAVVAADHGVDHVHARRADEIGDEDVLRLVVDLVRRAELLDHALVHHRDLGRHGHRLDLVVGDVDDGALELAVELLDLEPHLGAELGVEVGQRLVEQEQADLLDQRPADRDALALAAGELRRLAVEEMVDLEELRRPGDALLDLGARQPPRRQPELQVPAHRLGRVERVGLEDHGEAAVLGVEVGDVAAVDQDRARR